MKDIKDLKNVFDINWLTFEDTELKDELENISKIIQNTKYNNLQDSTKQSIVQILNSSAELINKPDNNNNKTKFSNAIDDWKDIKQSEPKVFYALLDPVRNLVQYINNTIKSPETKVK